MKLQILLLGAVAASALSIPNVVHERRFTETGLHQGQRVDGTSITTFRIGLKQNNLEHGYDYLMNISHPDSPHYSKTWSAEEVRDAFAPSAETIEAVQEWLARDGIAAVTESRAWVSVKMTVADAERLFNARYYEHEDHDTGLIRIGCDEYAPATFH